MLASHPNIIHTSHLVSFLFPSPSRRCTVTVARGESGAQIAASLPPEIAKVGRDRSRWDALDQQGTVQSIETTLPLLEGGKRRLPVLKSLCAEIR